MLLFKLALTIATFAALNAVLADPSICASVRYLFWAEAFCTQPLRTFGAFPWRTFCLLQLDALFAVLTQAAASLFAPLMRRKMLLETHSVASHAPILRHVPFLDGLPIDFVTTQLLQKQFGAFCWALREQLTLEGSVDKKLRPVLDARQRHIARDRTGALSYSQVHDRTIF